MVITYNIIMRYSQTADSDKRAAEVNRKIAKIINHNINATAALNRSA